MTAALLGGAPAVFIRKALVCRSGRRSAAACVLRTEARYDGGNPLPGIVHLLCEFGFDGDAARALCDRHRHVALLRPESLRRRLDLLRSAGLAEAAVPGAVARLPEILTSEKMQRLLELLAGELAGGIEPAKLERLLATATAPELAGLPDKIALLAELGVPRARLAGVLNGANIRKALCARTAEEVEETVRLLMRVGAEVVLRRPALLNQGAAQLRPRLERLRELAGGDAREAARLVRKLPGILAYTADHVGEHVEYWQGEGLSREQVFRVAMVYPSVFSASRERRLARRVELLRLCGVRGGEQLFRFLVKAPLFLGLSEDNLGKKLAFLVKLGHRPGTREMAGAVAAGCWP
ncbi:plastid transcriptionally active 15 [Wolffia australiana]